MILYPELFSGKCSPDLARQAFSENVKSVEIEISSYCNRTCSFCPNSFVDRRSSNTNMDDGIFSKIIDDLSKINYSGTVLFHRYNEPLRDVDYAVRRIEEVRKKLPAASLQLYTNGDYLDIDVARRLFDAGLRYIRVSVYLSKSQQNTEENYREAIRSRVHKKFGLSEIEIIGTPALMMTSLVLDRSGGQMKIEFIARNFDIEDQSVIFLDRGGLMGTQETSPRVRTLPCHAPFETLSVEYDGTILPCCNLRGDAPDHRHLRAGGVDPGESLFVTWANGPLVGWRRKLMHFEEKQEPCRSCFAGSIADTPGHRGVVSQLQQMGLLDLS